MMVGDIDALHDCVTPAPVNVSGKCSTASQRLKAAVVVLGRLTVHSKSGIMLGKVMAYSYPVRRLIRAGFLS